MSSVSSSSLSLHESIFREASQSPSESVSFSYSVETESSGTVGIETWISDQRCSSPEILWEDQSMKLFRFRRSNRERSTIVDTTKQSSSSVAPKATMSYPPKRTSMSAMSYEKYRRQNPPLSSRSDGNLGSTTTTTTARRTTITHHSIVSPDDSLRSSSKQSTKSQSVSLELATAWLQMGESRGQGSLGDLTSSSSSSGSSSSCSSLVNTLTTSSNSSLDSCLLLPPQRGATTTTTSRPVEAGARPRRSSTSLAVAASRQLQRQVRDSSSRDYLPARTTHNDERPNNQTFFGQQAPAKRRDTAGSAKPGSAKKEKAHPSSVTNGKIAPAAKKTLLRNNNNNAAESLPPKPPPPCIKPQQKQKQQQDTSTTNRRGVFRLHPQKDPSRESSNKDKNKKNRGRNILKRRPGRTTIGTFERDSNNNTMTAGKTLWRTAVDPTSGRTYYYHVETRETQWRKPLELATDEEKEEMRRKEEQQRSFFAAMEANILKNLATGHMVETTQAAADAEKTANFLPTRSVEGGTQEVERPNLIRTISTMDRQVLSELVKRQPSNRNLFGGGSSSAHGSPTDVTAMMPPPPTQLKAATSTEYLTDQTKTLSLTEDPPEQGRERQASMGTFLSDLPDDDQNASHSRSYLDSLGAGSFYDASADDLGVTEEEMDELTKLACISDQMSHLEASKSSITAAVPLMEEKPGEDSFRYTTAGPRAMAIRQSMRASMTNISLAVLQEDDDSSDHSGSSAENSPKEDDKAAERQKALENMRDDNQVMGKAPLPRPGLERRNTCGTIYVGSTMSAPDKDATIKCICGVYRAHILQSEKENTPQKEQFFIFNDLESQQKPSKTRMEPVNTPSLEEITAFYRDVFRRSQMETDCLIMSLIYVERLVRRTDGYLRPRSSNWRSVLFSCMILASKVWDDLSMWNADFSQTCPSGVRFSLQRINELEIEVLSALSYDVKVPASEYAKYYFLLRSMLIKSGLGSENIHAMNPLDVTGAQKLQQMSARYQASRIPARPAKMERRSVSGSQMKQELKVSLEHMVDL